MPEDTKVSKAQQRAVNKYVKNNYDRINVTFIKGQKELIQAAATAAGETVNGYIKKAVEQRIIDLCNERNIAINALANISGVSPSTIYSMLNEKSQNPGVVSIKKICDGLEISIREFFDSDLFDDLEQEIK